MIEALYDSHCHLDHDALAVDREAVIARAIEHGVDAVLVPAIEPGRWDALAALRARWSAVRIAIGVHPHALAGMTDDALAGALGALRGRALALGAAAIGECGFDRTVALGGVDLERQAAVVDAHVEVARALDRPLVLHVVGAQGFALARIARHAVLPRGGVVHAYGGSVELVPRWIALGFRIAIGPSISWPGARRPLEVARAVPLESLLIETDAPDGRVRGTERGEPAHAAEVARVVASVRGVPEAAIRRASHDNAAALLG